MNAQTIIHGTAETGTRGKWARLFTVVALVHLSAFVAGGAGGIAGWTYFRPLMVKDRSTAVSETIKPKINSRSAVTPVLVTPVVRGYTRDLSTLTKGFEKPPVNAMSMTKEEFRRTLRDIGWHGVNLDSGSDQLSEEKLFAAVGKPMRTQTIGDSGYWYWQCKDATVQVVTANIPEPYAGGRVFIQSVNDF
jgi:hypothetical protein